MKAIICLLVFVCTFINTAADGRVKSRVPFYITNAAKIHNVDPELMYAICLVESKCNAHAINNDDGTANEKAIGIKIKSYGLFQIKLATAEDLGFIIKTYVTSFTKRGKHITKHRQVIDNSDELLKPATNAFYAAKFVAKLFKKYQSTEKTISAYNAGHYITSNTAYVYRVLKYFADLKLKNRRK